MSAIPSCLRRLKLQPLLALLCGLAFTGAARVALPAYWFADFEADAGWRAGALPVEKAATRLVQGQAKVIARAEQDSAQVLQLGPSTPFAAVFVDTTVVASAPVVFCEVIVKPPAVSGDADAEFLDFGGAVVGFFRNGARGEVRALFARSAGESVWISTGLSVALDAAGASTDWLRLGVRLDRRTERWDLRINGQPALAGLRALEGRAAGLALWLYGQDTRPTLVDDLLVTTVAPATLEKLIHARQQRVPRPGATASAPEPQLVHRAPAPAARRSAQPALEKATREWTAPVLRAWEISLRVGDTTFKNGPEVEIEGHKTQLIIYSPRYDDQGNALPGELTLTADAELSPGTDLSRVRWLIAEMKKWPNEPGEVVAAGDFRTGLVQTATIPVEWIRKATTVQVWTAPGNGDVPWWRFRQRQEDSRGSTAGPANAR